MNVQRWLELREMEKNNPEELDRIGRAVAAQVGIIYAKEQLTAMDVLVAENHRDNTEAMKRIVDWFR